MTWRKCPSFLSLSSINVVLQVIHSVSGQITFSKDKGSKSDPTVLDTCNRKCQTCYVEDSSNAPLSGDIRENSQRTPATEEENCEWREVQKAEESELERIAISGKFSVVTGVGERKIFLQMKIYICPFPMCRLACPADAVTPQAALPRPPTWATAASTSFWFGGGHPGYSTLDTSSSQPSPLGTRSRYRTSTYTGIVCTIAFSSFFLCLCGFCCCYCCSWKLAFVAIVPPAVAVML